MTPFGKCLEKLRRQRGLQQSQLAVEVGIQPCYVSSIENGRKGPPSPEILEKIILTLELNNIEETELRRSVQVSKTTKKIPANASCNEYLLIGELWERLGTLSENQIQLISLALKTAIEDKGGRKYREI